MTSDPAATIPESHPSPRLVPVATLPRTRALAWSNDTLYVSQGYSVKQASIGPSEIKWKPAGSFDPPGWRRLTSKARLTHRLVRDGFHALAVLPSGHLV